MSESRYLERPEFRAEVTIDIDEREEHDEVLDDELMIRKIRVAVVRSGEADLPFEIHYEDPEGNTRTIKCRLDFQSLDWIDPETV